MVPLSNSQSSSKAYYQRDQDHGGSTGDKDAFSSREVSPVEPSAFHIHLSPGLPRHILGHGHRRKGLAPRDGCARRTWLAREMLGCWICISLRGIVSAVFIWSRHCSIECCLRPMVEAV